MFQEAEDRFKSMATLNIDNFLPSEIFHHIFKYLTYRDLKNVMIALSKMELQKTRFKMTVAM